jgi:hypothetical protein
LWPDPITRMSASLIHQPCFVTLNSFQGPFLVTLRPSLDARWMLKQVQHDD